MQQPSTAGTAVHVPERPSFMGMYCCMPCTTATAGMLFAGGAACWPPLLAKLALLASPAAVVNCCPWQGAAWLWCEPPDHSQAPPHVLHPSDAAQLVFGGMADGPWGFLAPHPAYAITPPAPVDLSDRHMTLNHGCAATPLKHMAAGGSSAWKPVAQRITSHPPRSGVRHQCICAGQFWNGSTGVVATVEMLKHSHGVCLYPSAGLWFLKHVSAGPGLLCICSTCESWELLLCLCWSTGWHLVCAGLLCVDRLDGHPCCSAHPVRVSSMDTCWVACCAA